MIVEQCPRVVVAVWLPDARTTRYGETIHSEILSTHPSRSRSSCYSASAAGRRQSLRGSTQTGATAHSHILTQWIASSLLVDNMRGTHYYHLIIFSQVLPFLLRRVKEDVLKELPPKITQDYYCELSPLQRELYEDCSRQHMPTAMTQHTHVFQVGSSVYIQFSPLLFWEQILCRCMRFNLIFFNQFAVCDNSLCYSLMINIVIDDN